MKLVIGLVIVIIFCLLVVISCLAAAGKADEQIEDLECWRYCDDDCLECFRKEKCWAWRQLYERKS